MAEAGVKSDNEDVLMQEAKFDRSGKIWFTEKKRKPPDPRRLQAAMFTDRPDL